MAWFNLGSILQHYALVLDSNKDAKLSDLLDSLEFNQVIVFVNCDSQAVVVEAKLRGHGYPSTCIRVINDDMEYSERLASPYLIFL